MQVQHIVRSIALGTIFAWSGGGDRAMAIEPAWDIAYFDPAAELSDENGATLLLPMPCGGAMAFQRVDVIHSTIRDRSDDSTSLLSDRLIRLGSGDIRVGHREYWRPMHLRGSFNGEQPDKSYYFIGRYEVTVAQVDALRGNCSTPDSVDDRKPAVGLSWFDAVILTRDYSEWLQANYKSLLPTEGRRVAFVRLPTEAEWEYAVRGGVEVGDDESFYSSHFFDDKFMELDDVAWYNANTPRIGVDASRNYLQSIGAKMANPLGLYDAYGNAGEIVLDSFQMNKSGRLHGQVGGITVRGGSIDSAKGRLHSAVRTERPVYNNKGKANAHNTDGVRFAIATDLYDDLSYNQIQQSWEKPLQGDGTDSQGALSKLGEIIGQETDIEELLSKLGELIDAEDNPSHTLALERIRELVRSYTNEIEEVRALVWMEQDLATSARKSTLKSMFSNGADLVSMIRVFDKDIKTMKIARIGPEMLLESEQGDLDVLNKELSKLRDKEPKGHEGRERLKKQIADKEQDIIDLKGSLDRTQDSLSERSKTISRDEQLLATALRAYVRLMNAFAHSYRARAIEDAHQELHIELLSAGEEERLALVNDVLEDIQEYETVPMTPDALFERVIDSSR